jgi:predicted nucleic acid-binding protein
MSFLLDTDICSAYLKGNRAVGNRFLQYTGGLQMSAITLGELYTWALRAKAPPTRLQALADMLNDVVVLDITPDIADITELAYQMTLTLFHPSPSKLAKTAASNTQG